MQHDNCGDGETDGCRLQLGCEKYLQAKSHSLILMTLLTCYSTYSFMYGSKRGYHYIVISYSKVELILSNVRANPCLVFLRLFRFSTLRKRLFARHISPIPTSVAMERLMARMMRGNWRCSRTSFSILGVSENSTSSVPTTWETYTG